jgi:hypothetical protein
LGGFTLDAVHHLDVNSSTLYYGNGERRIVEPNDLTVREQRSATPVQNVLVRRNGNVLIHETTALSIPHVYERRRDGTEVTILGCTSLPCAYDLVDVPAAGVNPAGGVTDIAEGPDGSIYFSTGTANKIRRIDPDGILRAFAGSTRVGSSPPWRVRAQAVERDGTARPRELPSAS